MNCGGFSPELDWNIGWQNYVLRSSSSSLLSSFTSWLVLCFRIDGGSPLNSSYFNEPVDLRCILLIFSSCSSRKCLPSFCFLSFSRYNSVILVASSSDINSYTYFVQNYSGVFLISYIFSFLFFYKVNIVRKFSGNILFCNLNCYFVRILRSSWTVLIPADPSWYRS